MPNISGIYKQECIFCEKDKSVISFNSREKLVKVTQLIVDETLWNIATEECDHMALASREIVVAEAHYHRSRYREYTRPKKQKQGLGCNISGDTQDAEFDAFSDQFEHIRAEVLEKQRVMPMTEVTNQFVLFARQTGIEKVIIVSEKPP